MPVPEDLSFRDLFRTVILLTLSVAEILRHLFGTVMSLDPSFAEESPEGLLAHTSKLAGFAERKHLLSIKGNCKLALELFLLPPLG